MVALLRRLGLLRLPSQRLAVALVIMAAPSVCVGEPVVFRSSNGRFLRPGKDGRVYADRLVPSEAETFELQAGQQDQITLRASDGRYLTAEGRDARILRADSPRLEPGDRETFVLVKVDDRKFAMRARNYRDLVVFEPGDTRRSDPSQAGGLRPAETVELYRASQIPDLLRSTLNTAVLALAKEELSNKEYDKIRTRHQEKFIRLPAPTARDLTRSKKHRVLSMREQYHVRARLAGEPDIRITQMPYLKPFAQASDSLFMFVVEAELPVQGRVSYQIPEALSATVGFSTSVVLHLIGQVHVQKEGDQLSFDPPEVLDLQARLHSLGLSNDLLQLAHHPIQDLINEELSKNQDRIRAQANKALEKALKTREFRHPLLRLLAL